MNNFYKKTKIYLAALLLSTSLSAVEKVTIDTWSEYSNGEEFDVAMQGLILELSFSKDFTLIAASAAGVQREETTDEKKFTAKDLALYPKYTFLHPSKEGIPGFALMLGGVIPTGTNFLSSSNRAYMAIASFPMLLLNERITLDMQLGYRHIDIREGGDEERLYWGVFAEANIVDAFNVFTNIYAGSQYDIDAPSMSQEYGLSYNYSENLKCKLLFGIQPELDGLDDADTTEYWGELGFEIYLHFD